MTKKMIPVTEETHELLGKIGRKNETFDAVVKRLIDGYNARVHVIAKIRALSGMAQSHNIGNKEMMTQIKSLENEAIKLLGV